MIRRKLYINLLIMILFIGISMILVSCQGEEDDIPEPEGEDKVVVGFSLGTLMEDRWIRDRDIFISMAQEEGIEVIVTNANKDSDLQYQQVVEMLKQDIDVLVIAPNDSVNEERCVKAAKARNIPVISYDRLVYNGNVDAYITFNNEEIGELMASYLVEKVPKGGYLIVSGAENDNNSQTVHKGWMNILHPYIQDGSIEILGETWVEGWKRETAFKFVSSELKKNRDNIDVIISGNDSLAWGAIDALSEAQVTKVVEVGGQDADLVACQRIITGEQAVTIYKPIKKLVAETVKVCLQLVEGNKIEGDGLIFDGRYEVPYIQIGVEQVIKDNIDDTVIKDGFHLYEDVYQKTQ